MSSSTKIIVPFHVTTDKILQVIAKVVGCPYEKDTHQNYTAGKDYGKKAPFDPNLPVSDTNKWHMVFDRDKVYYEHNGKKNSDNANLYFEDIAQSSYSWFAMLEDSQYEEGKRLAPDSTVTAVAVAKRLVNFFGGYAVFNDSFDDDDNYYYTLSKEQEKNIKYPHVHIHRDDYENVNYRWNAFQNALNNEPLLTVKELEEARKFSSYFTERDEALYGKLKILELHEKITDKVDSLEVKNKASLQKIKL